MKYFLLFICLYPLVLTAQKKGGIKGNVFYKYNDFIGNRADAGCKIYLFYPNNINHYKETTADLSGNFSFENLDTGQYLIAAKSNQIRESTESHVWHMYYSNAKKYFGVDIKGLAKNVFDSLPIYKKVYDSIYVLFPKRKKDVIDKNKKMEDARSAYFNLSTKIDAFLDSSPYADLSFPLFELKGNTSLAYKEITLTADNFNDNVVFDFGLSEF